MDHQNNNSLPSKNGAINSLIYDSPKNAKISEVKTREGVKYFAADLLATQAAQLSGLNRNTINRIYAGLHEKIYAECKIQRPMFGIVEVDESVFGAKRVKGKRGRGAYGKTVVFGIKERLGKVYTEIVPDCSKATLQSIIRGKVAPESVINSDGWRGYNGLVDLGSRGLGLSWTWATVTSECITKPINLPKATTLSTASRVFGVSQRCVSHASEARVPIPLFYTSKRPSGASTTALPISTNSC